MMETLIVHKKLEKKSLIGPFSIKELAVILSIGMAALVVLRFLVSLYALAVCLLSYFIAAILVKMLLPSFRKELISFLKPYIPSSCYAGGKFEPKPKKK